MTPIETLYYWVEEREAILQRRIMGDPMPWTKDPIMAKYRFCNVRREDDTVTRWIAKHIRKPFANHPHLWLMLCLARMINWPPTLELLIDNDAWPLSWRFNLKKLARLLDGIEGKAYTGAYIIPAGPGPSKGEYIAHTVIGELWGFRQRFDYLFDNDPSLERTHEILTGFVGWGPFLAYQAVVDIRFTKLLRYAPDVDTWAAAGPGTIRGLNRLHRRSLDYRLQQRVALSEMRDIADKLRRRSDVHFDFSDIPNILCETDKYLRVANNEGKPRSLYRPGGSPWA
jgi:hypothetical protein